LSKFQFNGSQTMIYPDILVNGEVLVVNPGDVVDLDTAPDGLWASQSAPKAPSAPATPTPDPTTTTTEENA
jgi:hypothetical protein